MRDMGTEMTPIASQEPSRTGTPVRATTPIRSPTSSVPSSPTGATQSSSPLANPFSDHLNSNKGLSEKELQMKTRKEIMILGTKLGKMNIAAWASKEEEDKDASTSLKTVKEKSTKSVIETRAAAWEEAEKAKYMARYFHSQPSMLLEIKHPSFAYKCVRSQYILRLKILMWKI